MVKEDSERLKLIPKISETNLVHPTPKLPPRKKKIDKKYIY